MKIAAPVLVSAAVVGGMAALSVWAQPQVGDRLVPTHFGLDGPDNFQPAAIGLWIAPAIAAGVAVLMATLPRLMPKSGRLERSDGAFKTVWISMMLVLATAHGVLVAYALGLPIASDRIVPMTLGAMLIVLGNLMGKIRYNYVFGVRTPWTLASERVWDRTHRFMGPWFMLWGAAVVALALFGPDRAFGQHPAMIAVAGGAFVILGLSLGYSYLASRRVEAA